MGMSKLAYKKFKEDQKKLQTENFDVVANEISSKTGKTLEYVQHALRIIGFREDVFRKARVFSIALRCESRFNHLAEVFPNLSEVTNSLLFASEMGRLSKTDINDDSKNWKTENAHSKSSIGINRNWIGDLSKYFDFSETDDPKIKANQEIRLNFISLVWLQNCVLNAYPNELLRLQGELRVGHRNISESIRLLSDIGCSNEVEEIIPSGYQKNGLAEWLEAWTRTKDVAKRSYKHFQEPTRDDPLTLEDKPVNKIWMQLDVSTINPVLFPVIQELKDIDDKTPETFKARQSQHNFPALSERELLKTHWYFPTPDESKGIEDFFKENLKEDGAYQYEALLIALSMVTFRPIANVLNLEFGKAEEVIARGRDAIIYETLGSRDHKYNAAIWRKAEHDAPYAFAKIRLPNLISNFLIKYLPSNGSMDVANILPKYLEANVDLCYEAMSHVFQNNKRPAERILRNYLSRLIYHETSNSALVRFYQTNNIGKVDRADRVALSYYLAVGGDRASAPYVKGCREIFGNFGEKSGSHLQVTIGTDHLDREEIKAAVKHLEGEVINCDNSNLIEKHNRFARYTLFILLALTGHRKSKTPVYFPWDIDLDSASIFLADKQVTGSEARFVPLCELAIEQFKQYIRHLNVLSNLDEIPPEARQHANQLSEYFGFDKKRPIGNAITRRAPSHGLFFHIRKNGLIQDVSTNKIDGALRGIDKNFTGKLRATLAQHLWDHDSSGREVQAFLGHQPEMHSFGSESIWTFECYAKEIRPLIDLYASVNGLKTMASPFAKKISDELHSTLIIPSIHLPQEQGKNPVLTETGGTSKSSPLKVINEATVSRIDQFRLFPEAKSYEKRSLDGKWASQRARVLVRQELDDQIFSPIEVDAQSINGEVTTGNKSNLNAGALLTEEEIKLLKEDLKNTIADKYPHDSLVANKLNEEVARYFKEKNRRGKSLTSAASINLTKTQPGPIEISFSRSLRAAGIHRKIWIQRVGTTLLDRQKDSKKKSQEKEIECSKKYEMSDIERLAQIAISLVCFDAVLVPKRIKHLIRALDMAHGTKLYKDVVTLRANVENNRFAADFSVIPSSITTTLITKLSFENGKLIGRTEDRWKQILAAVKNILNATMGARTDGMEWSLIDLCAMYQPYWHLRLPGALFSIAIGDFCGPAPLEISENSLFGDFFADTNNASPEKTTRSNHQVEVPVSELQKSAYKAIRSLLSKAKGKFESGTTNRRHQRAELAKVFDRKYDENLLHWIQQQQIVDLLVRYLRRLYTHGGTRKATLAFSSIEKYFSGIAEPLLALAWNSDFEIMKVSDYDALYLEVKSRTNDKVGDCTAWLKIFHTCARDTFAAPYCRQWSDITKPAHSRSSLLTKAMIDSAVDALRKTEHNSASALLIACANGYGLRRSEALGLEAEHISENNSLSVKKNDIRSLKSSDARRYIFGTLNDPKNQKIISIAKNKALDSENEPKYLFESSSSNEKLLETSYKLAQLSIAMLREKSGNNEVVLHDLRHTYATRLMLLILCPNPKLGITQRAMERLLGIIDEKKWASHLEVLSMPKKWPFGVDAVARVVGHGSVETLLNTYFHAAHLATAEYTHAVDNVSEMKDEWFASLLGIGRSTVTKQKGKIDKKVVDEKMVKKNLILTNGYADFYQTISKNVNALGRAQDDLKAGIFSSADEMKPEPPTLWPGWYLFDRILSQRNIDLADVESSIKTTIDRYGLELLVVKSFYEKFKELVELGLNDFEHRESNLAKYHSKKHGDMLKGRAIREGYLKKMHTKITHDNAYEIDFRQTLKRWRDKLNANQPTLICYSKDEFEQTLRVLAGLGIRADNCKYVGYGSMSESFKQETLYRFENHEFRDKSYPAGMVKTHSNPSVGIEVMGVRKNATPDRNFHLAMMIAYAACM